MRSGFMHSCWEEWLLEGTTYQIVNEKYFGASNHIYRPYFGETIFSLNLCEIKPVRKPAIPHLALRGRLVSDAGDQ
jgi:hypothetical protein